MMRNFLLVAGIILLAATLTICVGLAFLRYNVSSFARYWQGRANQPGEFLYIAIGDSAAQGIGASKPEYSYVGLLAASIERSTGQSVRVINLSKSGATVRDALREQAPRLTKYKPDLVTVAIGANDMKHYNAGSFRADYEQLLQALPPERSIVADLPVFGGRKNLTRRSEAANHTVYTLAQEYRIPVADVYAQLQAKQSLWTYASDFFHPNNRGYRIWYDAFWPEVARIAGEKSELPGF